MRFWIVLAAVVTLAFPAGKKPPGDQNIGTFEMTAEVKKLPDGGGLDPAYQDCLSKTPPIVEIPGQDFAFSGTFSRSSASGQVWMTLGTVDRQATLDGGTLRSEFKAT